MKFWKNYRDAKKYNNPLFRLSDKKSWRIAHLIGKFNDGDITAEESKELQKYIDSSSAIADWFSDCSSSQMRDFLDNYDYAAGWDEICKRAEANRLGYEASKLICAAMGETPRRTVTQRIKALFSRLKARLTSYHS